MTAVAVARPTQKLKSNFPLRTCSVPLAVPVVGAASNVKVPVM
jgi:hypothetical protein